MDALEALHTRASAAALEEPAPNEDQLAAMLKAAAHAPDHALMRPWRFIVVRGDARIRLGEVMAEATRPREPNATAEAVERDRTKPVRPPMLVVLPAKPREPRRGPQRSQPLA